MLVGVVTKRKHANLFSRLIPGRVWSGAIVGAESIGGFVCVII